MNAALYCQKQYTTELHDMERPVATFMSMFANSKRDPKRRAKPFGPEDYYWYRGTTTGKYPSARYGAAAKALREMDLLPIWSLFVYKDLQVLQDDAMPPQPLCLIHEDAILLGPVFMDRQVTGMLIAQHSASNQTLEMHTPDGVSYRVGMPKIEKAVIAEEDIYLNIFQ